MAKFIDVKEYNEKYDVGIYPVLKLQNTILLNVEEIKLIGIKKYSNGYAIVVFTNEDDYLYDCGFELENEAYEKMFELQKELNK